MLSIYELLGLGAMASWRHPVHSELKKCPWQPLLTQALASLASSQPQRSFLSCGLMACIYFKEAILILKRYLGELGTINTSFLKNLFPFSQPVI